MRAKKIFSRDVTKKLKKLNLYIDSNHICDKVATARCSQLILQKTLAIVFGRGKKGISLARIRYSNITADSANGATKNRDKVSGAPLPPNFQAGFRVTNSRQTILPSPFFLQQMIMKDCRLGIPKTDSIQFENFLGQHCLPIYRVFFSIFAKVCAARQGVLRAVILENFDSSIALKLESLPVTFCPAAGNRWRVADATLL